MNKIYLKYFDPQNKKNMIYIQSKTGGRTENQDFYGSAQTKYGELIIVCDGMGGHNGGRHAAETAVQIIIEEVEKSKTGDNVNTISGAITNANKAIWEESRADKTLKGMGTTVVALLITPEKAISFHVGDSRIYQLQEGKILFRTFDHSHVFEMVKAGLINEEQARLSEKSNIITRALGIQPSVDIEITDNLPYKKGDRFLLCTDGICGYIPENDLVEMASQNGNIEKVLNQLVEKIDAIGFENGGKHDNLTAALLELDSDSTLKLVEEKEVDKSPKSSTTRSKLLFYLLLVALMGSMVLNLYFLSTKKQEIKKDERIIIRKQIPKANSAATDTINALNTVKK
jgi:serine/threonine protein phosphatase PrpC